MADVKNRFKILLAQKEKTDGRAYTYEQIRDLTGISPTTLSNYARGTVTRFDNSTLVALCNFFGCELSELIEYPPVGALKDAYIAMLEAYAELQAMEVQTGPLDEE